MVEIVIKSLLVPRRIIRHDIGIDCKGNAGCYIGEPDGSSQQVKLNMAQPSGSTMQSFHSSGTEGFTTPVEDLIRMEMDCMFPMTCYNYNFKVCNKFQSQWDHLFGDFVSACEKVGDSVCSTYDL